MRDVRLTIKNYRCFDDNNPLVVDLGRNFTALIGPNNSGKSSLLRFFFEFRSLWQWLWQNFPALLGTIQLYADQANRLPLNAVPDTEEVFSNTNNRDIQIEIEIKDYSKNNASQLKIVRVICVLGRNHPHPWTFRFFGSGNNKEITKGGAGKWHVQYVLASNTEGISYDVTDIVDIAKSFHSALYIGPFRNAINEGASNYYDLAIGSAFIGVWDSWKTGNTKAQNRTVEAVTSDIRQIFDYDRLEINASQDNKTLAIYVDGKPYRLPEVGAGLNQFIIVLGNVAIRRPSIILIDEPELHLHPSLQIDFLTSLGSYAQDAVIYATHSVGLARSTADRIYSFQSGSGQSLVKPFEQTPNYAEFVGEMSFSAFREMGCDQILLVEGVHDVKTVQQFLRMLRKDHRIVTIPLGGDQLAKGGIEAELSELRRLSDRISALVDSERGSENAEPKTERKAFASACGELGINICVTQRRAIENYFSDQAIKTALGDSYRALGPYESLKELPNGWSKTDNWKIARQMSFADIDDLDVGEFLSNL
jgi:energy-coupling factor transporter ATP-binding protein EcfA2